MDTLPRLATRHALEAPEMRGGAAAAVEGMTVVLSHFSRPPPASMVD